MFVSEREELSRSVIIHRPLGCVFGTQLARCKFYHNLERLFTNPPPPMAVLVVRSSGDANQQALSKRTRCYQTETNSQRTKLPPRVRFVNEICAKPAAEGSSMNTNQTDKLSLAPHCRSSSLAFSELNPVQRDARCHFNPPLFTPQSSTSAGPSGPTGGQGDHTIHSHRFSRQGASSHSVNKLFSFFLSYLCTSCIPLLGPRGPEVWR